MPTVGENAENRQEKPDTIFPRKLPLIPSNLVLQASSNVCVVYTNAIL
jgi:hypothetical protein